MRKFPWLIGLWLVGAAHAAPPPAEVYGRLPAIDDMAISADGSRIVAAVNSGDIQALTVVNLADGSRVAGGRTPDEARLRRVGWAEDDIATYIISRTLPRSEVLPPGWVCPSCPLQYEFFRVGTLSLADGKMRLMLADTPSSWLNSDLAGLLAPVADDPGYGRMGAWIALTGSTHRYGLYRVNLLTGKGSLLSSYGEDTISFLLDSRGNVAVRTAWANPQRTAWRVHVRDGEGERLLRTESEASGHRPDFDGLLPDGRIVRVDSPLGLNRAVVSFIDPSTNAEGVLLGDPKYDIGGVVDDPLSHHVVGAAWDGEMGEVQHFFEPDLAQARAAILPALGAYAKLVSYSRARDRFIVFAELPDDAGSYFLFEPLTKKLTRLGRTYPELPAANLGQTLALTYPARDGMPIPAYLTLPPGTTEPRNLPLIVLVHGGPWLRDTGSFDFWAQFIASRGYLVLQPNYRGSGGYGDYWRAAGYKEWGGLMQRDVEDGADALARSGFADKARTCIMGASYGGYAALAGATLTPDRYACAVSVAGVSDLLRLVNYSRNKYGEDSYIFQHDAQTIGHPDKDKDMLRARSPATHAAMVRIPVLLIHGTNDTVVPIEQTRDMFEKLKRAGKDVRYVELPGDDHWLSRAQTRTLMLAEIEKFLKEKLPATPSERPVASLKPLRLPAGFTFATFEASPLIEAGGTKGGDPLLAIPRP